MAKQNPVATTCSDGILFAEIFLCLIVKEWCVIAVHMPFVVAELSIRD